MKYCDAAETSCLHITLYRLKKTSLFGTDSHKHHIIIILMFFNENENNDVKSIIPSNIANHIAIAISFKLIAMRYFLQNRSALIISMSSPCHILKQ